MSRYLLDTNVCIRYLKGEYDLRRKITQVGFTACFLSEITIAELIYGVENSAESKRDENRQRVLALQTSFADRILPINSCFDEYARQKVRLRRN